MPHYVTKLGKKN